ncbi:FkbM family methyltransferase [Crocosphaera sp. XPORK-15E]|uniref:FkbM family methyltransferase n=1 Tax=Crocosphaera sp. XPORK-15E TaxID=3110247 RepID=UPI002B206482|nr:FkbM family methyltransferase [Crocosphaera sp. XPORK-15E]MEA5533096.1 FkbM family methyltransferase [Crocosphaera sp. XPORK-15E]
MDIKDYLITKLRGVIGIIDVLTDIDRVLHAQKRDLTQQFLNQIYSGGWIKCRLNEVDVLAPIEPLKMYQHCLVLGKEEKFYFLIETHCVNWLCSKIDYGDVVLDIGAAYGVITLPLAKAVGRKGRIYAFEPAKKTQKLLQEMLVLNNIENITVVQAAISDRPGEAEFIEYTSDQDVSWASDFSTLNAPDVNRSREHISYLVPVTTIDDYVEANNLQPKAIKIDIEGFELYALYGAKSTLEKYSPYLCIDIHADVKTGKSALLEVEPFLKSLGYLMEMTEHTLLCKPKNS